MYILWMIYDTKCLGFRGTPDDDDDEYDMPHTIHSTSTSYYVLLYFRYINLNRLKSTDVCWMQHV